MRRALSLGWFGALSILRIAATVFVSVCGAVGVAIILPAAILVQPLAVVASSLAPLVVLGVGLPVLVLPPLLLLGPQFGAGMHHYAVACAVACATTMVAIFYMFHPDVFPVNAWYDLAWLLLTSGIPGGLFGGYAGTSAFALFTFPSLIRIRSASAA